MSFFDKISKTISENKIVFGVAAGAVAAFILYNLTGKEDNKQPQKTMTAKDRLNKQIQELKESINTERLNKDDLKQIFDFVMKHTQYAIAEFSHVNKSERREIKDVDFKSYLKRIIDGVVKLHEITVKISSDCLAMLGIPEHSFRLSLLQHPELSANMVPSSEPLNPYRQLDLNELREAIRFQKAYLENHGQELVDKIKQETADWDPSSKHMLPMILGVVVGDELYADMGLEDEQIQAARVKYSHQVKSELQAGEQVALQFMRQLDSGGNPLSAMMGMDPSAMGIDPSMFDNIDPAAMQNFMDMMGFDPSMLQSMDPNLMGFDPSMMQQMMGAMGGVPGGAMGGGFEGQMMDPTFMQQIGERTGDPEAIKQKMNMMNMMMHH